MMREQLSFSSQKLRGQVENYLVRRFGGICPDIEDIVSDAFVRVLQKIDTIENRFVEKTRDGMSLSAEGWLYSCLKIVAENRAIQAINKPRTRKTKSLDALETPENPDGYAKPIAIVRPEQEDIVFRRQLLEFCGLLPPDEREMMLLAMDHATLDEMVSELGISLSELHQRRARAIKKLMKIGKGPSNGAHPHG